MAAALVYEGESLSYGELNRHANRLAHRLLELGIRPDERVAICVERSLEMVIGLLGILKAGGAYVPLDPGYPEERLAYMLADSAPVAVLTQSGLKARLPSLSASLDASPAPVILLDRGGEGRAAQAMGEGREAANLASLCAGYPEHNPEPAQLGLTSRHLAYVIYTSGSTGQPKGVMVGHFSMVNFLTSMSSKPGIDNEDKILAVTTLSFDIAGLELFVPLINGAKIILVTRTIAADADLLQAAISKHMPSIMQATPATWHLLLSNNWCGSKDMKILCGGESLTYQLSMKLQNIIGELWNLYGPTETTVWSTCNLTNARQDNLNHLIESIGYPIANTQIYILDGHLQPVPIGVAGEIYIGGAGVARGYLGRAALTAERFVADPYGQGRLYKTGDLGRWLPDGSIEYLGRNDFQVKVRGFRIEPGEVEAQLAKCAGVKEAVVVAREDVPGDKRLVAYVIAEEGREPTAADLRAQLSGVLAEYMVPGAYVTLESFPLTPNGKLDRKALPAPDGGAAVSRRYEAPYGPVEAVIARIWQELLNVERVGRHDHFFELGGNSFLAVQLISKLKSEIGEISMNFIFSHPVLSNFSFALTNMTASNLHNNLVNIRRDGKLMPLFFIHPRGGHVNYARLLVPLLCPDLPIYGLAATGFNSYEIPLATVQEMAELYIKAIQTVQKHGPYRIIGYSSGGIIAYEITKQLIGLDEHVEFLGLIDTSIEWNNKIYSPNFYDECQFFLQEVLNNEIPVSDTVLSELKQLAKINNLNEMLKRCHVANLLPQEIDIEVLRRYLSLYYANDIAIGTYLPEKIPISVNLFAASDESKIDEISFGWEKLIGDRLKIIPIGGDHLTIMQDPHIQKLAKAICEALQQKSLNEIVYPEINYSPIILIQNGDLRVLPIFCVPGAGAGVTSFFSLSQSLEPSLPVYGLQPRGLDSNMVPHYDVESAARAYIKAIREISPSGPYRLLGHSFGGWVVFEMALQLLREGEKIDKLIVLDSEAPFMPSDIMQRYNRISMQIELIKLYELTINRTLNLKEIDLEGLGSEDQLHLLLSRLIEVNLMPPRTPVETLRGIVRVFETNINTKYVPKDHYNDQIYLIGVEQVEVDNTNNLNYYQDYVAKWEAHASNVNFWKVSG